MFNKKYRLSYLPLFYEDLDEKITYLVEKLKNPKAANDLLDKRSEERRVGKECL